MGRSPCCSRDEELNRGAWTAKEDKMLSEYINTHGEGQWRSLPRKAGLKRCGKSCRLRWLNYLRPNIKRGNISPDEEDLILRLHRLLGNRWSLIAGRLPGRTDNEIKNYWNTHLGKKRGMSESARSNTHVALRVKQSIPARPQKRSGGFEKSEKLNAGSRSMDDHIVTTRPVTYSEMAGIPDRRNSKAGKSQKGRQRFGWERLIADDHDIPMIMSKNILEIHPPSIEMQSVYPCTSFPSVINTKFTHNSENYVTAASDGISQGVKNFMELLSPDHNFMATSSPCDFNDLLEGSVRIEPANDFDEMCPFDNNKKNSIIKGAGINLLTTAAYKQGLTEIHNSALESVDWTHEECFQTTAKQKADSSSDE